MENVEEAVHLEPKVNKAILECQDYQVPKVILVFLGSQGNLVLMDPQENLARMGLKDNQALKEIWDLVDSWDREDSQVQLVSQAFLDWKAQKVQRAPWDLWVGPEILELQDHQDPLVLQVLRVQLVLRVCPALLESLDFQVFQVLMDCLVLPEHLDHQERKENQVHRDLKASLGILERKVTRVLLVWMVSKEHQVTAEIRVNQVQEVYQVNQDQKVPKGLKDHVEKLDHQA